MKRERPVCSQEIFWPIERVWYKRVMSDGEKIFTTARYNRYLFEICAELEDRKWGNVTDSIILIPGYYTLYGVNKQFKKRVKDSYSRSAHILINDFTLSIENGFIHTPVKTIEIPGEFWFKRHTKTGDIFKDVLVTRPAREGKYFLRDLINEVHDGDTFPIFYGPVASYVDKMIAERSSHEILSRFYIGFNSEKYGWPFEYYQGVVDGGIEPNGIKKVFIERIMNYFYGPERWYSNSISSIPEMTFEYVGRELIPPDPAESINGFIIYGNDSYTFPSTYVESKIVRGQEAVKIDILDSGTFIYISDAEKIIRGAREKFI